MRRAAVFRGKFSISYSLVTPPRSRKRTMSAWSFAAATYIARSSVKKSNRSGGNCSSSSRRPACAASHTLVWSSDVLETRQVWSSDVLETRHTDSTVYFGGTLTHAARIAAAARLKAQCRQTQCRRRLWLFFF